MKYSKEDIQALRERWNEEIATPTPSNEVIAGSPEKITYQTLLNSKLRQISLNKNNIRILYDLMVIFRSNGLKDLCEDKIDLRGARFETFPRFDNWQIDNNILLDGAMFTNCTFEGVKFNGYDLMYTEFYRCTFSNCFFSMLTLNNCKFILSKFYRKVEDVFPDFFNTTANNTKFDDSSFYHLRFNECNFNESSFVKSHFIGVDFFKAKLIECDFDRSHFSEIKKIYQENDKDEIVEKKCIMFDIDFKTSSFIGVDTSNVDWSKNPRMKRFIEQQQYVHAAKEGIDATFGKKAITKPIGWGIKKLISLIDYLSDPLNWVMYAVATVLLFAVINSYCFEAIKFANDVNWFTPIYYSVVTFSTLGFGDIAPLTWYSQLFAVIEVVLGYVFLGGLVTFLANWLGRR